MPVLVGIPMDPRIVSVVMRYIGHGWHNSVIISLIRYKFDAPITSRCINNIRALRPCSSGCACDCRLRSANPWFTPIPPVRRPIHNKNLAFF